MALSKLVIWANEVKRRDRKCVVCGTTYDLHAHHIKPKSSNPELAFDISNGITLCYRCHKVEHERNRQVRIRTKRPQRKTLIKRIEYLERTLFNKNKLTNHIVKPPI